MNRTAIPIRNMHCKSCELLIERALLKVPGIKSADVSHRTAIAVIRSEGTLNLEQVRRAIEGAGYEVGESEKKLWFTRDTDEYGYLAIGGFAVIALYITAKLTGLLELSMTSANGSDLASAILLGLTAGVSTCMALVGGLVLGVSARHAEKHPEATALQKFRPHLFFNIGRIAGFFVLGGFLGTLGGFVTPSALSLGILTIVVAIVMLVLGLQLTEIFPRLSGYKLTLPAGLARMLGLNRHTKEYSHTGAATLGALTFFLPCGFTQLMQVSAVASGSFLAGGIIMGAFAIGTAPGLLGIGGLTSVMRGVGAKIFFKTAGILVIVFALFNFTNGYNLTGWAPFWQSANIDVPAETNVTMENGVQVARMQQTYGDYVPNTFVVKRGIPVRWIIDASIPNSCTNGISVPSLGILKTFEMGQNVFEFTPDKTGVIRFTCTMGMFPGQFIVID